MIKPHLKKNQRLIVTLASATFIIIGTLLAIRYAKGYRPTREGTLAGTGVLEATSNPQGARILIDGVATNKVTDETINLKPGNYDIEIRQDGFTTWKKNILIESELVTTTNAHLFRSVPALSPLTFSGAINITPSPDGQKLAFTIASPSAQLKDGLYVLELNDRPNLFNKGPKLIADTPQAQSYTDSDLLWAPDSTEIIASFANATYLLDINSYTKRSGLTDASSQLSLLLSTWEEEITQREKQLLLTLPDEMIQIATASAKNIYFSPDGEKLLYTATQNVTIPEELIPQLPASNSQPQSRQIEPGSVYIYDLKEDRNFLIYNSPQTQEDDIESFTKIQLITNLDESTLFAATDSSKLRDPNNLTQTIANFRGQYSSFPFLDYQWFPTSKHVLINSQDGINIIEYDNTNQTTLFQGTYYENFVYPWPNGSKIIILTNLTNNPNLPPNLYSINLK